MGLTRSTIRFFCLWFANVEDAVRAHVVDFLGIVVDDDRILAIDRCVVVAAWTIQAVTYLS